MLQFQRWTTERRTDSSESQAFSAATRARSFIDAGRIDRILLAIISLAGLGQLTDSILGLFEKWAIAQWA